MIADLVLGITCLVLLLFNAWNTREYHKNTKSLIKALMSKDAVDYVVSERVEEKKTDKTPDSTNELVDIDALDAESLMKLMKGVEDGE